MELDEIGIVVLIESGCLPLRRLIESRRLKFFRWFKDSLQGNSVRKAVFDQLLEKMSPLLQHHTDLDSKYADSRLLITEHYNSMAQKMRSLAANKNKHYKFWIYSISR